MTLYIHSLKENVFLTSKCLQLTFIYLHSGPLAPRSLFCKYMLSMGWVRFKFVVSAWFVYLFILVFMCHPQGWNRNPSIILSNMVLATLLLLTNPVNTHSNIHTVILLCNQRFYGNIYTSDFYKVSMLLLVHQIYEA